MVQRQASIVDLRIEITKVADQIFFTGSMRVASSTSKTRATPLLRRSSFPKESAQME